MMRTSEVLNKAADLIEERGWTTGDKGWTGPAGAPLCVESALATALGMEEEGGGCNLSVQRTPAYAALMQHTANPFRYMWKWNDESDGAGRYLRTQADVIETLRAAAVIEAVREDAALLVEVSA